MHITLKKQKKEKKPQKSTTILFNLLFYILIFSAILTLGIVIGKGGFSKRIAFTEEIGPLLYDTSGSVYGSGSMRPSFSRSDKLYYTTLNKGEHLQVGDVARYSYPHIPDKSTIHRVVFVLQVEPHMLGNYYYIFQGDANTYPDQELVPHENIIDKLIAIEFDKR